MKNALIAIAFIFTVVLHANAGASLNCGAATTDRIGHGTATNIDDFNTGTVLVWVKVNTFTDGRAFFDKTATASSLKRFALETFPGTNQLAWSMGRVTANLNYVTNNIFISTGTWYFFAVSFSTQASAGEIANIYFGSQTAMAVEATYDAVTSDGSGAFGNEGSAANLFFGGTNAGGNLACQCLVAYGKYTNRQMTLAEIQNEQFNPQWGETSGLGGLFSTYAIGTGSQFDLSGNNNAGTITGCTESSDGPPIFLKGYPL